MGALLVKGSIGRGEADELSDVDLVVVTAPGARDELWEQRAWVAERLGEPLGLFVEAPWHDPFTAIALYDGPLKVDLFFQDAEGTPDPWLRDGYVVLHDEAGVADRLRDALATAEPPQLGAADVLENDAHAWDWAWWMHVKLLRGEDWLVYVELVQFLNTIVVPAHNAVAGEPWRGMTGAATRLPPDVVAAMRDALPRAVEPDELRRSLRTLVELYARARPELVRRTGAALSGRLMEQVRAGIDAS